MQMTSHGRRRILSSLVLLSLLTGCATGTRPGSPAPETSGAPSSPSGGVPASPDGGPGLQPLRYEPGKVVPIAGAALYLMDAETGATEVWPAPPGEYVKVNLSPGGRFVWANTPTESILTERATGKSWRWNRAEKELIAATDETFLLEEIGPAKSWTGRFRLELPDGSLVVAFTLPSTAGETRPLDRLTSLTNEQIEFVTDRRWVLDIKTKDAYVAPLLPARYRDPGAHREIRANVLAHTLPVVEFWANGAPEARYIGAYNSCGWSGLTSSPWSADGRAVAVLTMQGRAFVDLEGHVTPIPGPDGADPAPSPTAADRWGDFSQADGQQVLRAFNAQGGLVARATFAHEAKAGGSFSWDTLPVWHQSGRYLQFRLYAGGGRDFGCATDEIGKPFLPPRFERAPFPETTWLKVEAGDCLKLYPGPNSDQAGIACLPAATRVALQQPSPGEYQITEWSKPRPWIKVRTEDGNLGWVSTDRVTWAD